MKRSFFSPQSIAVIGVSEDSSKLGHQIFMNIIEHFEGDTYPVNLREGNVCGHRVYASVADIGVVVDMAIIVIPGGAVPKALMECGEKGIQRVVVISAGFGEMGEEGKAREAALTQICESYGMEMLGPNCLGFLLPGLGLNASFAPHLPKKGNVAFVSQSGAMAVALMDWAAQTSIGFSLCVSMGNKAMMDETTILEELYKDPHTDVVMLYLESIEYGTAFMEILGKIAEKKSVIIMKAGSSTQGQEMVASHTGRIAKEHDVFVAYVRERGVLVADSIETFFDYGELLARHKVLSGNRVGIITNAGGPGVLTTDAIDGTSLQLIHPSKKLHGRLAQVLPAAASLHNPIDMLGDATGAIYEEVLHRMIASKEIDACIVLLTPQSVTNPLGVAEALVRVQKKHKRMPIVSAFMGGQEVREAISFLEMHDVVHFEFPHRAVRVLDGLWTAQQARQQWKQAKLRSVSMEDAGDVVWDHQHVRAVLQEMAVAAPWSVVVALKKDISALERIPFPVVVKVDNAHALHKSDEGGVRLHVGDRKELWEVVKDMKARMQVPYVIVEEQVTAEGQEVFAGFKRSSFGDSMVLGVGGIYAEVMEAPMVIPAPFTKKKIRAYVMQHVLGKLLLGYRGMPIYDVDALVQALVSFGVWFQRHRVVKEVDMNPLFVTADDVLALDVKIMT